MARRISIALATVFAAVATLLAAALPAWAAESITLTWVRHAESTANAAGIISSTVPGPGLTALGETQAVAVAETLAANAFDGIYASDMIRTSLTAAPLAAELGLATEVVGGVREIAAGILEGLPGTTGVLYALAGLAYIAPAAAWVLGARVVPGLFGEDGNIFDARVDGAVAEVYASGDTNPVIFSHGGTIQAWALMNVLNPVLLAPLENTDVVVMTGNPEDGWTLQSWAGTPVSPTPGLLTKLFLNFRELVVAPQTALYNIGQALRYENWYPLGSALPALLGALGGGIVAVATAAVDFVVNTVRDIAGAIIPGGAQAGTPVATPAAVAAPPARVTAPAAASVRAAASRAEPAPARARAAAVSPVGARAAASVSVTPGSLGSGSVASGPDVSGSGARATAARAAAADRGEVVRGSARTQHRDAA